MGNLPTVEPGKKRREITGPGQGKGLAGVPDDKAVKTGDETRQTDDRHQGGEERPLPVHLGQSLGKRIVRRFPLASPETRGDEQGPHGAGGQRENAGDKSFRNEKQKMLLLSALFRRQRVIPPFHD